MHRWNNGFANNGDGDTRGIAITVIPTALRPTLNFCFANV